MVNEAAGVGLAGVEDPAPDDFSPQKLFRDWEGSLSTAEDVIDQLRRLARNLPSEKEEIEDPGVGAERRVVWRGLSNATYALHSTLYRYALEHLGGAKAPTEDVITALERQILGQAQNRWRFDGTPALEVFAQLQHLGGPTRLVDVSYNPLVALWFACEAKFDRSHRPKKDTDGRIFLFVDLPQRRITLDEQWNTAALPWDTDVASQKPGGTSWSTSTPFVWRPPAYNARIPAQDAAFLVGGVPVSYAGTDITYRVAPGSTRLWPIDAVRRTTSVQLPIKQSTRAPHPNATPAYTLRIPAALKPGIRDMLSRDFGYTRASIYPDNFGIAQSLTRSITGL